MAASTLAPRSRAYKTPKSSRPAWLLSSTRTLTFPTPSVLGYSNFTGSPCFSTKCGRLPSIRALPPPFT